MTIISSMKTTPFQEANTRFAGQVAPASHEIRRFITVHNTSRQYSLFWAARVQPTFSRHLYRRSIFNKVLVFVRWSSKWSVYFFKILLLKFRVNFSFLTSDFILLNAFTLTAFRKGKNYEVHTITVFLDIIYHFVFI